MSTFVAVDIQNVFFHAKKLKKRLNFQKLHELFQEEEDLLTCNAYVATSPFTETSYLINTLKGIGFNVIACEQKKERKHLKFNNRSVGITLDVVRNQEHFDKLVVVTMDEGIVDLLDHLRDEGIKVEIWSLTNNETLKDHADEFNLFEQEHYVKR